MCIATCGGACPYGCPYCYVQAIAKRFNNQAMMGPLRFQEKELNEDYYAEKLKGKTLFIEHTHDLFNEDVERWMICKVLEKASDDVAPKIVLQTRNTRRAALYFHDYFSPDFIVGTTIESSVNVRPDVQLDPIDRAIWLCKLGCKTGAKTFVTIEPILEFDLKDLIDIIDRAHPDFVNIGADSKGTGLEEPSAEKVLELIEGIKGLGIEIRTKRNLERILRKDAQA